MTEGDSNIIRDPWQSARKLTRARIALGRAGGSLPTGELLDFSLAHARARDAVHASCDFDRLMREVEELGFESLLLESQANDRREYLLRPDLGRRLNEESQARLRDAANKRQPSDLVVIVSDGLSGLAADRQVTPVLSELLPRLQADGWRLAPVTFIPRARVAVQDEVGEILNAGLAVILLGERPGLAAPDSLGAYFVCGPARGKTDADRNCVSNIRTEGLAPGVAAETLQYLLSTSRNRNLSGVHLKDDRPGLSEGDATPLA